jgi:hypothetical protein
MSFEVFTAAKMSIVVFWFCHRAVLIVTNVSEEHIFSIFRIDDISQNHFPPVSVFFQQTIF